jgi:tetratricopeptide (TPR) repeat protein
MQPATTYPALTRRGLILHDALAFLALLATSVALFGVTLFLFRSFEQHRADLAVRWADRGRIALQQSKPDAAVTALRTSLSYAPDERANQLLLAQALAQSGHTEEATNYFLNLWEARPGDGFINLQLARLARQKGEFREATDYYRASIFGSWEGDGVIRRREVRLELSDFLIQQHLNAEARNELFTVAGNAPNNVDLNLTVASKLEAAGYLPDALTFLQKAIAADPHNRKALELAGQAAYTLGDYPAADHLLHRALDEPPYLGETPAQQQQLAPLAGDARRIQELSLAPDQPATIRANHILAASKIAQARLRTCLASPGTAPHNDPPLDDLNARWTSTQSSKNPRRMLLDDPSAQDAWTQLIYLTERNTAQACGTPTGDDALLLQLANAAGKGYGTNGK